MLRLININNDINKITRVYQTCDTTQTLMFCGYLNMWEWFVYPSWQHELFQTMLLPGQPLEYDI